MKRFQLFTPIILALLIATTYSCKEVSNESTAQKTSTDSTELIPQEYEEVERVNIVDTLSFSLTSEDKSSLEDFKKATEPKEYYEYDENKLQKLADLYSFYHGQEAYWWSRTSWAEKSKLQSVDKLIEEISLNPNSTTAQLAELSKYSQKLKTLFLSRDEIVDENKIPYDQMTTALLDTVISLGSSIPNMTNYQTFNLLVEDIDSLHNKAQLALRRTHIASIDSLNTFTAKNKKELLRAGIKTDSLTGWAY